MSGVFSVTAAAEQAGEQLALLADGRGWTWRELAAEVETVREGLEALGARPGRPVVFDASHTIETVFRLLACFEAGLCAVPMHTALSAAERARRLAFLPSHLDADPGGSPPDGHDAAAYVWDARPGIERGAQLDTAAAVSPDVPMAILFTSGSGSGIPRAVELSRAAFAASARMSAARLGWRPDDRWLCCLPLAHVGGLSVLTRCLAARRALVLAPFDAAETPSDLEAFDVTLASVVPTMLQRLDDARPDWRPPPALRAVLVGGAAAPGRLLAEARRRGLPVRATYGMTETCSQVATARASDSGTLVPLDGVDVRVVDGVVEVGGPMLCARLTRSASEPSPWRHDGYLRTGDRGRLSDGVLEVLGRVDDVIVTGGENVDPVDVERILIAHPLIRRAVVFGVPDPEWGELVGAAIDTAEPVADDDLSAWLGQRLAAFARPRRFYRPVDWPSTASGKLDRRAVAVAAIAGAAE